jgi:hypothetical protein
VLAVNAVVAMLTAVRAGEVLRCSIFHDSNYCMLIIKANAAEGADWSGAWKGHG